MLPMPVIVLSEVQIQTPVALLLLVTGFGFVIFVHELGHFLAAKGVGIRVSQFAIGFGHALLSYRKGMGVSIGSSERQFNRRVHEHLQNHGVKPHPHQELELTEEVVNRATAEPVNYSSEQTEQAARALGLGETEYRLNWLPLGGYVKMLGQEDLDPKAVSDDPRSYSRKPVWARLIVVSAGVVMNAIFALVFFITAFMYGVEFPPAVVGGVMPGSPANTTPAAGRPDVVGLREGDVLLAINGERPDDFFDLAVASALAGRDEKITLEVERPGGFGVEGGTFTFELDPQTLDGQPLQAIGAMPPESARLIKEEDLTQEGSPFGELLLAKVEELGLRPGMRLVSIDGQPAKASYELSRAVTRSRGEPIKLGFADEKGEATVNLRPETQLMPGQRGGEGDRARPSNLLGLVPLTKVAAVEKGRAADGLLMPGDLILQVGSVRHPTAAQLIETIRDSEAKPLVFTVLRDGGERKVTVAPRRQWRWFGAVKPIGVYPVPATDTNRVASVVEGSPFAALNLITPARIVSIGGEGVETYSDIRRAVEKSEGPIEVAYTLPTAEGGQETRTLELAAKDREALAALPWSADLPPFEQLRVVQRAENIARAAQMGFDKTWVFMVQTYQTLRGLFARTVPAGELRGPVGIAHAGTQLTRRGWTYLMFFLGVISVNLAVLNFLPLPILDGGLAVLLLLEKLRGRPVPVEVQNGLSLVGLALLLSLILFVTYNDIMRLITNM